jgi:hypothetical protein
MEYIIKSAIQSRRKVNIQANRVVLLLLKKRKFLAFLNKISVALFRNINETMCLYDMKYENIFQVKELVSTFVFVFIGKTYLD